MIKREDVVEAINKMSFYLVKSCDKNGKFKYRINKNPTIKVQDSYNILRHAGAIYALTDFSLLSKQAHDYIRPTLKNSKKNCVTKIENYKVVLSTEENTNKNIDSQVKLGANALGLLALLRYENYLKTNEFKKLQKFANFILNMQKSDGSFYSKYYSKNGKDDSWNSLYYPGEAAYALFMYYVATQSYYTEYFNCACGALIYLKSQREFIDTNNIEADHWSLIATGYAFNNIQLPEIVSHNLAYHAKDIVQSILNNWDKTKANSRTCQISTRIEGLLSYHPVAEFINDDFNYVFEYIEDGISFLLQAYEKRGSYIGGITREYNPTEPNDRSEEIRIDYVQHALSAMVNFYFLALKKNYWTSV